MRKLLLLFAFVFLFNAVSQAATFEQLVQDGQAAYKSGDFARAGSLLRQAGDELQKKKDSRAPLLWGNAAIALMKAEDYAAAAELYEQILSQKNPPKDKLNQYYNNLIISRGKLNQPALQLVTIDRMLKAIPKLAPADLAEVYAMQGDTYRSMELYASAVTAYDKALHVLPQNAEAEQRARLLTAIGLSQGNLGDYALAEKNLIKAKKLAEQLTMPLTMAESDSNLGLLHREKGNYPEAMELLEKALATETQAGLALSQARENINLGIIQASTGNFAKAMEHVEAGLKIAMQEKDVKEQAIASVNRAFLHRIAGNLKEARADYAKAIKLFEQAGFQEGQATTMIGLGKMAELADKNYVDALENYQKALDIYTRLELPRSQTMALLQLADLHKRIAKPGRTTRDMVFDDEPTTPEITGETALAKSAEYYTQCLALAERMGLKELVSAAHQGLGFNNFQNGKLETALEHYKKAIEIVTAQFVSMEDAQILGEYMAEKEALYNEAVEVCAALYQKTKDRKYLDLQLQYAETLKNEIQKAATALANLKFENKVKQKMFETLQNMGKAQAKLRKSLPVVNELPANASPEQKAANDLQKKAKAEHDKKVAKLDGDYKKLLAQWEMEYPGDKLIFDSAARIDISKIQKNISNEQVVLLYNTLPNKLIITTITNTSVNSFEVNLTKENLENLIKKEFLIGYLEDGYGRNNNRMSAEDEKQALIDVAQLLNQLYKYLIEPVKSELEGKKRLYIVNDGYLAQFPYAALVKEIVDNKPHFLIEDYDIGYIRPSFINNLYTSKPKGDFKKLLAVANPKNKNFWMKNLPGAISEVGSLNSIIHTDSSQKNLAVGYTQKGNSAKEAVEKQYPELVEHGSDPTEQWFYKHLEEQPYEMLYFATHGMPYSNIVTSLKTAKAEFDAGNKLLLREGPRMFKLAENNLAQNTPLNGFLYMGSEKDDDVLTTPISPHQDGLLTIKEIAEIPEKSFAGTKYVILSACNTGVSFAPIALKDEEMTHLYSSEDVEKDLIKAGWLPGVDQVSFVDIFMRRGVPNVYGSMWPVDDNIASFLMRKFLENLMDDTETKNDAVASYSKAQRDLVTKGVSDDLKKDYSVPEHPYFWAVGAMFGK